MKKVSIYIRSKEVSPSGYYRVLQYANKLKGHFIIHNILPPVYYRYYLSSQKNCLVSRFLDVFTYFLMYVRCIYFLMYDILNGVNIVVVSRGLLPRFLLFPIPILLQKIRRQTEKIIWDFDDDILLSKEISAKEYFFWSQNSDKIFVTHDYLANKINGRYHCKIVIIPTTDGDFTNINLPFVLRKRKQDFGGVVKLVWTGSAVNIAHIIPIINSLDYCAKEIMQCYNKRLLLQVCSSAPLICSTKYLIVENIKWERLSAVKIMEDSHIGIMPLLPSEYSLGKGGFKLIQYMAAGLPIIGSDVGFNSQIIQKNFGELIKVIDDSNEWLKALLAIVDNWGGYEKAAICSLENWNYRYPFKKNLDIWSEYLEVPVIHTTLI